MLSDISFVSDVIGICCAKVTIGNESIYVLGIYRSPDKAKLPEFDVILNYVLSRFDANDFVFIIIIIKTRLPPT